MSARLRDLVAKRGIDKFTAEDFKLVTDKVAIDPDRLILVGGQAIEVWGVFFDVPSPHGKGNALTEDTDWLGGKLDAKWLCDQLGGQATIDLQFAGDFDTTPSSAIAFIQREDRILLMDFLRAIVGPTNDVVKKLAVRVACDGGEINVLHPLHCLHSRLANLKEIPKKRTGNGIAQAHWMIDITKAFLLQMVPIQEKRQLAKACRNVATLAEFGPGRYCYEEFGIDPMQAIDDSVVSHIGGKFSECEWPRVVSRIRDKQDKWAEFKRRTVVHLPGSGDSIPH